MTAISNTATLALDDLEELVISLESNANITRRSIIADLGNSACLPKYTRELKWNNTIYSRRGINKMMMTTTTALRPILLIKSLSGKYQDLQIEHNHMPTSQLIDL